MITVLVKFKISDELNLKTLKEKFIETSVLYVDVEGLLRKNYIADIEKGFAGGVYTFSTIENAKKESPKVEEKKITENPNKQENSSPKKKLN